MLIFLLSVLAVAAAHPASHPHIDPALLASEFGTKLEDITVSPTTQASLLLDEDGDVCKCVPYYYCFGNMTLNNGELNDPTKTGYGMLDVRFKGPENCQESIERCCKIPRIDPEVKPLKPDASRLKGCGYRNVNGLDFTVTGGHGNEAQFGEFPWVVAIMDNEKKFLGVGVLIHPQVVMTGAIIVHKLAPGDVVIRAGEWDTQTSKERLPFQERVVEEMRIRKDFCPINLFNDMALLRLESPVELSDHINVACLPQQGEDFGDQTRCIANGWGKDKFGRKGRYAVILKKMELAMVPHATCNQMLKNTRLGINFKLHRSFVCAGGEEGKDMCQGDGGAPLVCPTGDNRYTLAGLVAWGIGCGEKDKPGVYAKVSLHRDWVDAVMTSWDFETSGYKM